ncbi:MAG: hypothetical protein LBD01_06145 [Puniceicoccales bacterium]|jgi:hypothetical protein|nr:hypothetical protein [Puniceicoccales bacterium]
MPEAKDMPEDGAQGVISPWRMGWVAARANFIPGLILQAVALALVVTYYTNDAAGARLDELARLKDRVGFAYSATSGAFFCGLLPWFFRVAIPSLRPRRLWGDLVFSLLWWAAMCMGTDAFYRGQAMFWGAENSVGTVILKTACDMLIFTPITAAPLNAISHLWKENEFSFIRTREALRGNWYRKIVMPNLVPNWMLWTPGIALVYSLPTLLQVPMANLIGCFWSLLCITIAAGGRPR